MESLKTEKIRIQKQAEVFINKTATQTLTSTSVVEKVINFQFRDMLKAFKGNNSTVEMSGFGTFWKSRSKMEKKVHRLELVKAYFIKQLDNPLRRRELTDARIEKIQGEINFLLDGIKKIHEDRTKKHSRRMEKSPSPTTEPKESDRGSLTGETSDMQVLQVELGKQEETGGEIS